MDRVSFCAILDPVPFYVLQKYAHSEFAHIFELEIKS